MLVFSLIIEREKQKERHSERIARKDLGIQMHNKWLTLHPLETQS